jgi:hypothetical protein
MTYPNSRDTVYSYGSYSINSFRFLSAGDSHRHENSIILCLWWRYNPNKYSIRVHSKNVILGFGMLCDNFMTDANLMPHAANCENQVSFTLGTPFKGQCHENFNPRFFHQSTPPRSLIHGLKPFCILRQYRREIWYDCLKLSASAVSMRPWKPLPWFQWGCRSGFSSFNETE